MIFIFELYTPTIARKMPRILTLAQLLGYEHFHGSEESKLTYIRLNTQTPCPPRGAVPVNQGRAWKAFSFCPFRIEFGDGCDCPAMSSHMIAEHLIDCPVAGDLATVVYPDGSSITKNYNLLNQVTNTVDGAGVRITNWFNDQGLLYASSNAFHQVFAKGFDIEDRVTNSVDGNGIVITNTYDNLGRLLTRSYPDDGNEYFGYSASGLIAYTNQLTNKTYYAYDA